MGNAATKSWLDQLAQRRLIIVTGKGGTGKSSLAAALAYALSARGKSVFLAEIGRARDQDFMRLGELLGIKSLGHQPKRVAGRRQNHPPIAVSRLEPEACLFEYLGLKLGSPALTKVVLQNRITTSIIHAVPGLAELVALGKIWYSLERAAKPRPDLVILDAPASGHALSLLFGPAYFASLTKAGPIFADARSIADFLADPQRTAILFATLAEEVPFSETQDFCNELRGRFPEPQLVVNRLWSLAVKKVDRLQSNDLPESLRASWSYAEQKVRHEETWLGAYQKEFGSFLGIPVFQERQAPNFPVAEMAQFLDEGNNA